MCAATNTLPPERERELTSHSHQTLCDISKEGKHFSSTCVCGWVWSSLVSPTSNKQVNSTGVFDGLFKVIALFLEVLSISVKNVNIGWVYVNVLEEVLPHVRVVALGMIIRDTYTRGGEGKSECLSSSFRFFPYQRIRPC